MTASLALSDFRVLRDLANRWEQDRRSVSFAAVLHEALNQIAARRDSGPDFLHATVHGDSLPEMEAAALARAAELYGPDAKFEVVETGSVSTWGRKPGDRFSVSIRLHCLNYSEVSS